MAEKLLHASSRATSKGLQTAVSEKTVALAAGLGLTVGGSSQLRLSSFLKINQKAKSVHSIPVVSIPILFQSIVYRL